MDKGPCYGIDLLDKLPLGGGVMKQALPSRSDLVRVRKISERTVAGYEVLLDHYYDRRDEVERISGEVASVLQLLDGLAEVWGDEGVFRRCRDRLRTLVDTSNNPGVAKGNTGDVGD